MGNYDATAIKTASEKAAQVLLQKSGNASLRNAALTALGKLTAAHSAEQLNQLYGMAESMADNYRDKGNEDGARAVALALSAVESGYRDATGVNLGEEPIDAVAKVEGVAVGNDYSATLSLFDLSAIFNRTMEIQLAQVLPGDPSATALARQASERMTDMCLSHFPASIPAHRLNELVATAQKRAASAAGKADGAVNRIVASTLERSIEAHERLGEDAILDGAKADASIHGDLKEMAQQIAATARAVVPHAKPAKPHEPEYDNSTRNRAKNHLAQAAEVASHVPNRVVVTEVESRNVPFDWLKVSEARVQFGANVKSFNLYWMGLVSSAAHVKPDANGVVTMNPGKNPIKLMKGHKGPTVCWCVSPESMLALHADYRKFVTKSALIEGEAAKALYAGSPASHVPQKPPADWLPFSRIERTLGLGNELVTLHWSDLIALANEQTLDEKSQCVVPFHDHDVPMYFSSTYKSWYVDPMAVEVFKPLISSTVPPAAEFSSSAEAEKKFQMDWYGMGSTMLEKGHKLSDLIGYKFPLDALTRASSGKFAQRCKVVQYHLGDDHSFDDTLHSLAATHAAYVYWRGEEKAEPTPVVEQIQKEPAAPNLESARRELKGWLRAQGFVVNSISRSDVIKAMEPNALAGRLSLIRTMIDSSDNRQEGEALLEAFANAHDKQHRKSSGHSENVLYGDGGVVSRR